MKIARKLAYLWMILVAFGVLFGPIVWLAWVQYGWMLATAAGVVIALTSAAYWTILEGDPR